MPYPTRLGLAFARARLRVIGCMIVVIYASGIFCHDAKLIKGTYINKKQPATFCCEYSDDQGDLMPKYKEIDYKGPRSRWPLWVIPFLVAILLLLIGIFIFVTLGAKHHRCLFFDCEQPRDKVIELDEPRNDAVIPPKDESTKKPDFGESTENKTSKTDQESHFDNLTLIHGDLIFDGGSPQTLPQNSLLKVKFEDVSIMDASSVVLGETMVNLSSYDKAQNLKYAIKCKKPDPRGMYSVSAVLNMGWQADKKSWIRKGDYFTDTNHNVKIEKGLDEYKKDIHLVRYN